MAYSAFYFDPADPYPTKGTQTAFKEAFHKTEQANMGNKVRLSFPPSQKKSDKKKKQYEYQLPS